MLKAYCNVTYWKPCHSDDFAAYLDLKQALYESIDKGSAYVINSQSLNVQSSLFPICYLTSKTSYHMI